MQTCKQTAGKQPTLVTILSLGRERVRKRERKKERYTDLLALINSFPEALLLNENKEENSEGTPSCLWRGSRITDPYFSTVAKDMTMSSFGIFANIFNQIITQCIQNEKSIKNKHN